MQHSLQRQNSGIGFYAMLRHVGPMKFVKGGVLDDSIGVIALLTRKLEARCECLTRLQCANQQLLRKECGTTLSNLIAQCRKWSFANRSFLPIRIFDSQSIILSRYASGWVTQLSRDRESGLRVMYVHLTLGELGDAHAAGQH